jgi:hypothetical protein
MGQTQEDPLMLLPVSRLWPLLVLGGLFVAGGADAALLVSEVKDDGGFFKAEAIAKANKGIKEIKNLYKKDLVIESYKGIPADRKDLFEKVGKTRFFDEWARDRARHLEVQGIYILISREPAHLQVEVGNETQKKAFTLRDRERLVALLVENFKQRKFDEGLLEAVEMVRKTLDTNLK